MLAATQAFLLRRLLFDPAPGEPAPPPAPEAWLRQADVGRLMPLETAATDSMLRGVADMLWAAATHVAPSDAPLAAPQLATVALLPSSLLPFSGSAAQLLELLLVHRV